MSVHTPGPWAVDHEMSHPSVIGPDGFTVADCDILSMRKGAPTVERCSANARLIAAAPDVLSALKAVVAIADRKTDEFDAARAAIAKAEGRL